MHHSKSVKTFNLATSLSDYSQEASAGIHQRMRLETNLFEQQAPERMKAIRFEEQRAYDFVGVKELKAYYERARRMSKDKRKDTLSSSLGLSRHSVLSRQEEEFFNKWQILERVETKIEPKTHIQNNLALSRFDFTARDDYTPRRIQKRSESRQTESSSIVKMRNNFKNYRQGWEKELQRTEQAKGFPSLLRLATESRSISLKKSENQQSFKKENIPPRMWAQVLRDQRQLKNIYDRTATRIASKAESLAVSGKNKLVLEKEWLSRKGDEGYKFQMIKKQKYET